MKTECRITLLDHTITLQLTKFFTQLFLLVMFDDHHATFCQKSRCVIAHIIQDSLVITRIRRTEKDDVEQLCLFLCVPSQTLCSFVSDDFSLSFLDTQICQPCSTNRAN